MHADYILRVITKEKQINKLQNIAKETIMSINNNTLEIIYFAKK